MTSSVNVCAWMCTPHLFCETQHWGSLGPVSPAGWSETAPVWGLRTPTAPGCLHRSPHRAPEYANAQEKTNGWVRECPVRRMTNKPPALSHHSLWSCTISSFWCHPQFCSALSHLRINCSCSPAMQLNRWDFTCELLRIHLEQLQSKITFSQAQYDRTN